MKSLKTYHFRASQPTHTKPPATAPGVNDATQPTAASSRVQSSSAASEQQYIPMPSVPIQLQISPVFEPLLEILREIRLAQVATVDQQRELTRYMTDFNDRLEHNVRGRQTEIRGVNARIENLRRDVGNMAASRRLGEHSPADILPSETGTPATITTSGSVGLVTTPELSYHPGIPDSAIVQPRHGYPVIGGYQPLIPLDATPSPEFSPVIPPAHPSGPQWIHGP